VIAIVLLMDEQMRPQAVVPARWFPPPVLLPGLILGCGNVTYAAMSGFLILLLRERGHNTAWAFSAFAFAVLFGRFLFGGLPDRIGPRRTLLAGYALLGAGLIAVAAKHSGALDAPAAAVVGLGYSLPWPALASVVVGRVSASERASALGALTAFYDVAVAASSALAGAIAGHFGLSSVFWFAFACVPVAIGVTLATGIGAAPISALQTRTPSPSRARYSTGNTPRSAGTAGSD
jgi:MFS family permease